MTAIGILLIVQCIALWGIMAALHRHTSQLRALRERLDAFRPLPGAEPGPRAHVGEAGADHATARETHRGSSR